MEVLDHAEKEFATDPRRTFLTGHSMGGHGTWILGVTYPDRFAAIAPSAGWISMFSYAGLRRAQQPTGASEYMQRAVAPSDTLSLLRNITPRGVYVLHGDKDDNVPVDQARTMRKELSTFHPDFTYYERPVQVTGGATNAWIGRRSSSSLNGIFSPNRKTSAKSTLQRQVRAFRPGAIGPALKNR